MASHEPDKETVSIEEALQAEMFINQALIDLLVTKGVITHDELLERVQAIRSGQ
ncbi:MAG: hypothetical protein JRG71_10055 [Deltaproteobacteria bacterium]|nr:hypothetical protein [Deltaproteobacteria bacterium]